MNHGPYRLASGGAIDRSSAVGFYFDGRALQGFAGDSVASALLANGRCIVARSLKFHRPRGVFSAGLEEPNALFELDTGSQHVPLARAPTVPLTPGLRVRSYGGWPSVRWDFLRTLDLGSRLFAAGFYNKTFMWPGWNFFEPVIRALAAQATVPPRDAAARYAASDAHCDVLVVGGGVAGMSAALAAARAGRRVWLVESEASLGGHARWSGVAVAGLPAAAWIAATERELRGFDEVRILTRTRAASAFEQGIALLIEGGERSWLLRAGRMVLATGAIEQPLIFDHNDRPGIMLAGAARRYLNCQAIAPGRRVVVATNNDSAYDVVHDLLRAGVNVVAVTDSRAKVSESIVSALGVAGLTLKTRCMPVDTRGARHLTAVTLGRLAANFRSVLERHELDCDALLVSGGLSPALQLFAQSGGKLVFEDATRTLVPAAPCDAVEITGLAAGTIDPAEHGVRVSPVGNVWRQWVDLRHDVTVGDLRLAVAENYRSIEHVKRYTTVGMSVDQGKTSSAAAIEIVAHFLGRAPSALGHTTLRPPESPLVLGAFAGRARGTLFAPWRESPLHDWHRHNGALLEDYGEWRRPSCYPRPHESREQAIVRESQHTRAVTALLDASSLGKIEVHGADACALVDRFYANRMDTLRPYQVRYGLMLREDGTIWDDGTVTMLAPDRLLLSTTSSNSERVAAWLEEWRQCEWPSLRAAVVPVTDQWATLALAGAGARQILERLRPECDVGAAAFPHLTLRETRLLGHRARVARVSFSGELTYEVSVPAHLAVSVWEEILATGRSSGLNVSGIEALGHLRLEKGFIHVGIDTDSTTVPADLGWGAAARAKPGDFVGKRSLSLAEHVRADRRQLIGLRSVGSDVLSVGAHLCATGRAGSDGWITSAGRLLSDGSSIALAMLTSGRERIGERIAVHDAGRPRARATVTLPPFYDPNGERMRG